MQHPWSGKSDGRRGRDRTNAPPPPHHHHHHTLSLGGGVFLQSLVPSPLQWTSAPAGSCEAPPPPFFRDPMTCNCGRWTSGHPGTINRRGQPRPYVASTNAHGAAQHVHCRTLEPILSGGVGVSHALCGEEFKRLKNVSVHK
jgi:hypothetical protein